MFNSIDFFQAFFGPIHGRGTAFDTLKTLGTSIARSNPNENRNLVENSNRRLREPLFGAHSLAQTDTLSNLFSQRVS